MVAPFREIDDSDLTPISVECMRKALGEWVQLDECGYVRISQGDIDRIVMAVAKELK